MTDPLSIMCRDLPAPKRQRHRADIDGLRAIAVVAVILYHAGVPGFSGGFVGVDVFFVISGYLITQLLTTPRHARAGPALADFYIRRARRILPALLFMCFMCGAAASAILLPWDLPDFAKYLAATAVMLSNVPPWREGANYFDSRTAYVALTHLWSIGVEEQFYLLYPLTLLAITRYLPRRRLRILAGLAAVSFAVCVWGSYHRQLANFFLSPSRAWELLLGGAVASAEWRIASRQLNEALGAAALSVLAGVIFFYTPLLRYPGIYTLLPCAAAATLMVTGRERPTYAAGLLSRQPLVFTGLISYSLYLWHLPILMFVAYYQLEPVGRWQQAGLLLLIYGVAALSWRLIETPFRIRRLLGADPKFVAAVAAMDALLLCVGLVLWHSNGFPQRFSVALAAPDEAWSALARERSPCLTRSMQSIAAGDLCSYGPQTDTASKALVWGDSHALALLPAYEELARARQMRIYFAVKVACRPLLELSNRRDDVQHRSDCARFNESMVQAASKLGPALIILNAHWTDINADLEWDKATDATRGAASVESGMAILLQALAPTQARVCAVRDVPGMKYSLPHAVSIARVRGLPEDFLIVHRAAATHEFRDSESAFDALEKSGRLVTSDPRAILCPGDTCNYQSGGGLLYADQHHLSTIGALMVEPALDSCFAP